MAYPGSGWPTRSRPAPHGTRCHVLPPCPLDVLERPAACSRPARHDRLAYGTTRRTLKMQLLAWRVVAQPTTVRNAINEQFVHAYLPVRSDVEGHGTLATTNRLLERCAGVFLNQKLTPLLN